MLQYILFSDLKQILHSISFDESRIGTGANVLYLYLYLYTLVPAEIGEFYIFYFSALVLLARWALFNVLYSIPEGVSEDVRTEPRTGAV
jgi:hypothetical protein